VPLRLEFNALQIADVCLADTVNLVALEATEVDAEGLARLTGERARHLLDTLAVAPGREVRVGVLDGAIGIGKVIHAADDAVSLRCRFTVTPPRPPIDLLLALPRPKVLRRLWAQLAALGVGRIMLTNAERVERNYFDTHLLDSDVYRPLLVEGLQQARDTRVPIVSVHRRFRVAVEDELDTLTNATTRIVADPSAGTAICSLIERGSDARVLLAVGPEGGWNTFELELLAKRGFVAAGMGPRTLRIDTACIALLALVHEQLRT
jgi:RsmE family RNA methyltransferase